MADRSGFSGPIPATKKEGLGYNPLEVQNGIAATSGNCRETPGITSLSRVRRSRHQQNMKRLLLLVLGVICRTETYLLGKDGVVVVTRTIVAGKSVATCLVKAPRGRDVGAVIREIEAVSLYYRELPKTPLSQRGKTVRTRCSAPCEDQRDLFMKPGTSKRRWYRAILLYVDNLTVRKNHDSSKVLLNPCADCSNSPLPSFWHPPLTSAARPFYSPKCSLKA